MKKSLFSARRAVSENGQLGLMETGCIEESLMRRGLRMGRDEDSVLELHAETPTLSAPFKMFQNLREYRHLLRHFISRDLKTRYHGSIIGWGWSIAEPLALTVTFYILFAILSDSTDPYRPFNILIGILVGHFSPELFPEVQHRYNAGLIQRIYFPREIFLLRCRISTENVAEYDRVDSIVVSL